MKNQTIAKPNKALLNAAQTVFIAMAYEETIRPVITGIQKDILSKNQFKLAAEWEEYETIKTILEPKDSYLMENSDFAVYQKECHEQYIKNGFDVKPEYCPLLIAENMTREAKRELIKAAEYITNITFEQVSYSLKNYKKLVDLTLNLCAPFIDSKEAFEFLNK